MSPVMRKLLLLLVLILLLYGCARQPAADTSTDAPEFFSGIWNGVTLPFSAVGMIILGIAHTFGFLADWSIRLYSFPNSGPWYDLGFVIGLIPWKESNEAGNRKNGP